MHKLVILIEPLENPQKFEDTWPQFLHYAERMPGLVRETSGHVDTFLYGSGNYTHMHELYFDSRTDAQNAMSSPDGRAAGALLQQITGGRLSLFLADHREDNLENIRRYKPLDDDQTP